MSDLSFVDLVVCNDKMKCAKIQVKYRKMRNGVIELRSETVVNGISKKLDKSMVDFFVVYCPDNDTVYSVPTTFPGDSVALRVIKAKSNQRIGIRNADDFKDIRF